VTPLVRGWRMTASALLAVSITACTPPLTKYRTDVPALELSVLGQPPASDGRVRFREIYCGVLAAEPSPNTTTCDDALVRLSDEPPARSTPAPLPGYDPTMHILFVGGAFGECFRDVATPFPADFAKLSGLGYQIRLVNVDGRSSSTRNAGQIADAVRDEQVGPGEKLVLMGYSKGTPDILEFLVRNPELATRVDAVVSFSGAVNGSPLGDAYAGLYDMVAGIDLKMCGPGDHGVLDSLRVKVRTQWLARHRLPANVRYFSVGSISVPDQTARLMFMTKSDLDRAEALNDGQTIFYDQLLPGSVLLGYAHGDHWAVVLPLQEKWPYWGGNSAKTHYPRDLLLEAVVLYVGETLSQKDKPAEQPAAR
jgi:hypothetical protein